MSVLWYAAAVTVLMGATLQSAIGFGFSLVAAPLVFAAMGPEEAVGLLLLLGALVNFMTIATERRVPAPLPRPTVLISLWAVPGMIAGVAVLQSVDGRVLQVLLTIAVFAGLAAQRVAVRRAVVDPVGRPLAPWALPAAGLSAGALTTTTTTSGPPIVLLLLRREIDPGRVRDTLSVIFLAFTFIGAAVLLVAGVERALPERDALLTFLPVVVVGHLAGRPVFRRLARGHYETVLTVVLVVSAITGLLAALL